MRTALIGLAAAMFAIPGAQADPIVVQPGDTLSRIAERELGDGARWPDLCEMNASVLGKDCNLLQVGALLDLPDDQQTAAASVEPPADRPAALATGPLAVTEMAAEGLDIQDDASGILIATSTDENSQHRVQYSFTSDEGGVYYVKWVLQPTIVAAVVFFTLERGVIGTADLSAIEPVATGSITRLASLPGSTGLSQFEFAVDLEPLENVVLIYYPIGQGAYRAEAGIRVRYSAPTVSR